MDDFAWGFGAALFLAAVASLASWTILLGPVRHEVGIDQQVCMLDVDTTKCASGKQLLEWLREGK